MLKEIISLALAVSAGAELADTARELNLEAERLLAAKDVDGATAVFSKIVATYEKAGISMCGNGFPLGAEYRMAEVRGFSKEALARYRSIADRCGEREARRRQLEMEYVLALPSAVGALYSEAEEISIRINVTGGSKELFARRQELWSRIVKEYPKSTITPLVLFAQGETLQTLRNNTLSP